MAGLILEKVFMLFCIYNSKIFTPTMVEMTGPLGYTKIIKLAFVTACMAMITQ